MQATTHARPQTTRPTSTSFSSLMAMSLRRLPRGRGRTDGVLVWLGLWSFAKWRSLDRRVWPSNVAISKAVGLPLRRVERGLAFLRAAGRIEISYGARPRGYRRGRMITLCPVGAAPNPVIVLPSPERVARIWGMAMTVRERPGSVVALVLLLHACADIEGVRAIRPPLGLLRAVTGAGPTCPAFGRRLDAAASAGLLRKLGKQWRHGVFVAVVRVLELVDVEAQAVRLPPPSALASCRSAERYAVKWAGAG